MIGPNNLPAIVCPSPTKEEQLESQLKGPGPAAWVSLLISHGFDVISALHFVI